MFDQNKIQQIHEQIEEIYEFSETIAKEWKKLTGETGGIFNIDSFGEPYLSFGEYDLDRNKEPLFIPWRFVTHTQEFIEEYQAKQKQKAARLKAAETRKKNTEIKLFKQLQQKYGDKNND